MKIVFVGKEWKFKNALKEELFRYVNADKIVYLEKFDISFSLNENTLIVTSPITYPLVSKIISSMLNQNLIIKENQLIPENATYSKNSFLVKINNFDVNVILFEKEIPKIFLTTPEYEELHIFNFDKDSVKMFIEPIFHPRKIDYTLIENEGGFITIYTEPLNTKIKNEILKSLPFTIFGDIFKHIIKTLPPKKITFAESCTGGLIASTLTKYSGSSNCFDGSVVTYANRIKHEWLGVDENTLQKYGAVSEQTVKEMLLGAIDISKAQSRLRHSC